MKSIPKVVAATLFCLVLAVSFSAQSQNCWVGSTNEPCAPTYTNSTSHTICTIAPVGSVKPTVAQIGSNQSGGHTRAVQSPDNNCIYTCNGIWGAVPLSQQGFVPDWNSTSCSGGSGSGSGSSGK
jgi:hypothetical protein